MIAIKDSPARRFLLELGELLPKPEAIVVASAHWETVNTHAVSLANRPETIHDFGGFPDALFEIQYPAAGAPEVARKVAKLAEMAGVTLAFDVSRGLDHGVWVPLSLMYPKADIPVVQVSLLRTGTPDWHWKLGEALSPLRDDGILFIGSGSFTHNLREFKGQPIDAPVPSWVSEFEKWMDSALYEKRCEDVMEYRNRAPFAERNHPTEEHLLPLFFAMGAAGSSPEIQRLHSSFEYGILAMSAYSFT